MSWRTNRRTGQAFRRDIDPTQVKYQGRFACHICREMFGQDVTPEEEEFRLATTGRETPGTPLSTFATRAERDEHIQRIHGGQRFPERAHRQLGRLKSQTEQCPKCGFWISEDMARHLEWHEEEEGEDSGDIMAETERRVIQEEGQEAESLDSGDILGTEEEKEELLGGDDEGEERGGILD